MRSLEDIKGIGEAVDGDGDNETLLCFSFNKLDAVNNDESDGVFDFCKEELLATGIVDDEEDVAFDVVSNWNANGSFLCAVACNDFNTLTTFCISEFLFGQKNYVLITTILTEN